MEFTYTETATIALNGSLSAAVNLEEKTLIGIVMPDAWTAASITFDVSHDGTTYCPLYYNGAEFVITEAAASRAITLDPVAFLPFRYLKVRSGINGTVVAQEAARSITLLTKPIA